MTHSRFFRNVPFCSVGARTPSERGLPPASPQQQRDLRARDAHEPGVVLANIVVFFGHADDSRADREEVPKL